MFLGRHERDKVSRPETLYVFRHSLQTADVDATHTKILACSCNGLVNPETPRSRPTVTAQAG